MNPHEAFPPSAESERLALVALSRLVVDQYWLVPLRGELVLSQPEPIAEIELEDIALERRAQDDDTEAADGSSR